jgi:hypothetical protein
MILDMIDPVTLAVVTSAVSYLALKVVEGTTSEAGKDLWSSVRRRLGLSADPSPDKCQWTRIVTRLVNPNCYEA